MEARIDMEPAASTTSETSFDVGGRTAAALPRPPGPQGLQAAKWLSRYAGDLWGTPPRLAAEYGDVVALPIPFPGTTATLVSHPDHVDHVMTRHTARYPKVGATNALTAGEPPALPLLAGAEWKRVRTTFNPFFAEKALAGVTGLMMSAVTAQLDRWQAHVHSGEEFNVEHAVGTVTMAGLLEAMFQYRVDQATLERWVEGTGHYGAYVVQLTPQYGLPQWLPRAAAPKGRAAQQFILGQLDAMIDWHEQTPASEVPDLMDALMSLEFDGTPEMQYRRARSELSGLVFAGFDTSAYAIAWTIAMLCRNPDALGEAYAQVDALGGVELGYEHLEQLTYVRACFDEAQRLQAIPLNVRKATGDDEIGGYRIPKDSYVMISPYGLQRDPRFWKDPEAYRPSRFFTDEINKSAFIPFSIGPRKCMGTRMAYIQGTLTLAAILQRYTFVVRDGWRPRHKTKTATALQGGLPARIYARRST